MNKNHHHDHEMNTGESIFPPNVNIASGHGHGHGRGPKQIRSNSKDSGNTNGDSIKTSEPYDDSEYEHYRYEHENENERESEHEHDREQMYEHDNSNSAEFMSIPQSQETFDTPNSRSSCVRFMDEVEVQAGPTPASYRRKPPASLLINDAYLSNTNANANSNSNAEYHADYQQAMALNGGMRSGLGVGYCTPEGIDVEHEPRDIEDPHPHSSLLAHLSSGPSPSLNANASSNANGNHRHLHRGDHESTAMLRQNSDELGQNSKNSNFTHSPESSNHLRSSRKLRLTNSDIGASEDASRQHYTLLQKMWHACPCLSHAQKLSWSRVSSAVVRHAPCFWCCFRRSQMGGTDRDTLIKLNYLCAMFALWQFGVGIFILFVFLSNSIVDRNLNEDLPYSQYAMEALTPNLWMMSGSLLALSIVGFFLFCTMIVTVPIIRRVNLVGAIKYMWVLYWILPLQIFLVIALFDYHSVTDVWIKHWWDNPSMAWFRSFFCELGTANNKCKVSIERAIAFSYIFIYSCLFQISWLGAI